MRQETVQLYKFDELPEEAKEEVLNKHRFINVNYDWWEFCDWLLEPTSERRKELGLKDEKNMPFFKYKISSFDLDRGSYLQLEDVEIENDEAFRRMLGIPWWLWEHTYYTFSNNKSYRCGNTDICFELVDYDLEEISEDIKTYLEWVSENFFDQAKGCWDDIMSKALGALREEYYASIEDDQVADSLIANGYDLTEDGEIWG